MNYTKDEAVELALRNNSHYRETVKHIKNWNKSSNLTDNAKKIGKTVKWAY